LEGPITFLYGTEVCTSQNFQIDSQKVEISESELKGNKEAEDICPVGAIKIADG